jgi:hypothetical protein
MKAEQQKELNQLVLESCIRFWAGRVLHRSGKLDGVDDEYYDTMVRLTNLLPPIKPAHELQIMSNKQFNKYLKKMLSL